MSSKTTRSFQRTHYILVISKLKSQNLHQVISSLIEYMPFLPSAANRALLSLMGRGRGEEILNGFGKTLAYSDFRAASYR